MTTLDEADKRARLERARETGLFRYSLVQELTEAGLAAAERGWRARELAGRAVELVFDPFDLDHAGVRLSGKAAGTAVPVHGRTASPSRDPHR